MTYMIGILEEMNSWSKAEDDESRLNKSSIASAVFKILLFGADISQVKTRTCSEQINFWLCKSELLDHMNKCQLPKEGLEEQPVNQLIYQVGS